MGGKFCWLKRYVDALNNRPAIPEHWQLAIDLRTPAQVNNPHRTDAPIGTVIGFENGRVLVDAKGITVKANPAHLLVNP